MFIAAIISMVVAIVVVFLICKHTKLKTLVTSLALQQIKGINAVGQNEHVHNENMTECKCNIQWYTFCIFTLL